MQSERAVKMMDPCCKFTYTLHHNGNTSVAKDVNLPQPTGKDRKATTEVRIYFPKNEC